MALSFNIGDRFKNKTGTTFVITRISVSTTTFNRQKQNPDGTVKTTSDHDKNNIIEERISAGVWQPISSGTTQKATTTKTTPTTTLSIDLTNLTFKVGDKFHAAKPLPIYTITKIEEDGIDIEYTKDDGSIGTIEKGYTIDKVNELFEKGIWKKVSTPTTTQSVGLTNNLSFKVGDKFKAADNTVYTITRIGNGDIDLEWIDKDGNIQELKNNYTVTDVESFFKTYTWTKVSTPTTTPNFKVGDKFINKKGVIFIITEIKNGEFKYTYGDTGVEKKSSVGLTMNELNEVIQKGTWDKIPETTTTSTPTITSTIETTPTPTSLPKQSVFGSDESLVEQLKKDVSQLLFIRSLLSPIDFEKKIEIGQEISKKQKEIDILIFRMTEKKVNDVELFDNLFEQSFTPIQNTYDGVYAEIGNEEFANFFTPNGKPSALSDELNALIRTKQFKEWFGDWQLGYIYKDSGVFDIDCSKVLTSNFEPLLVWHGTGQDFSYFKFDTFPAAYFAVNEKYSKWFAELHGGDDGYTIPFFLNIRNPLDLTPFGTTPIRPKDFFDYVYLKTGLDVDALEVNPLFLDPSCPPREVWMYIRNNPKMILKLSESKLTDGIHFYETNPGVPMGEAHQTEAYIIFNANQCKIAAPNRGLLLLSSLQSFLLKRGGKI